MSLVELLTKDIWSFESSLSLVCPANCGFCNLEETTKIALFRTSSAFNLRPLGIKLLYSQNSFRASKSPDLNPFKCDPP